MERILQTNSHWGYRTQRCYPLSIEKKNDSKNTIRDERSRSRFIVYRFKWPSVAKSILGVEISSETNRKPGTSRTMLVLFCHNSTTVLHGCPRAKHSFGALGLKCHMSKDFLPFSANGSCLVRNTVSNFCAFCFLCMVQATDR